MGYRSIIASALMVGSMGAPLSANTFTFNTDSGQVTCNGQSVQDVSGSGYQFQKTNSGVSQFCFDGNLTFDNSDTICVTGSHELCLYSNDHLSLPQDVTINCAGQSSSHDGNSHDGNSSYGSDGGGHGDNGQGNSSGGGSRHGHDSGGYSGYGDHHSGDGYGDHGSQYSSWCDQALRACGSSSGGSDSQVVTCEDGGKTYACLIQQPSSSNWDCGYTTHARCGEHIDLPPCGGTTTHTVPEPASLGLLAGGVLMLLGRRRRLGRAAH